MKVIKRDGTEQEFNSSKIQVAICSAMEEVDGTRYWNKESLDVMGSVEQAIFCKVAGKPQDTEITIEHIQDLVEVALMIEYPEAAKAYILYRSKRAELRTIKPDAKAVASYIHASKYAKYLPEKKRREVYAETVARSVKMHMKRFPQLGSEIVSAFKYVFDKKVLPSMRSMQFGGGAIEAHNARMYNCSFTLVDRPRVFQEIFYLLLCGCGVGFSVQKQHVAKLPKIGEPDTNKVLIHHVEDSIEGWADTIGLLLNSYQHGLYFEPCYDLIRPRGSILKTGGGRAPGHLPLKKLVIEIKKILDEAIGRRLRPIECHDIICYIAEAVLAGGIRRSSLISLFSKDDDEMISSKSAEHFNYSGLNSQRVMANNSVVLLRNSTTREEFMNLMNENRKTHGEPGFMFTNDLDHGTNPCGEIGIDPTLNDETGFGFCNLCEINVAVCKTNQEFYEAAQAAAFIGTLQAAYTNFPYLTKTTEEIVKRDALLGVGLVGIMDNPKIGLNSMVLKEAAKMVVGENKRVAKIIGINQAVRSTTVKPSGTSSLELGCVSSGIHPHHARRYFRRITANVNEPVAQYFQSINPHMVEKKPDGDLCLTFPIEVSKESIVISDLTPIAFMENIFKVFDNWVFTGCITIDRQGLLIQSIPKLTHNISSTVVVGKDEWDGVLQYAWNNRGRIRAMSFFPKFGDKEIPYAPREEVTEADEAKWKYLIKNYKPVDFQKMVEEEDVINHGNEPACSGDSCDIVHVDSFKQADGIIYFTNIMPLSGINWLFETQPLDLGGIQAFKAMYCKRGTTG